MNSTIMIMEPTMVTNPNPNTFGIEDVVAVNLECFGLIILGYFARKFHLIEPGQTAGLNVFLSYYALPALVFLAISTISLTDVNGTFVQDIFISKTLIFLAVAIVTFILSYKSMNLTDAIRRSAMFAMFTTQSNDFALGYPILQSLYGQTKTSFTDYLYILAPIQLLILNPIALFSIEISQILDEQQQPSSSNNDRRYLKYIHTLKRILKRIFINPIILSTILGIIVNLITANEMPKVFIPFLKSLSQSFSPIALFLLGLNINIGNGGHQKHRSLKLFSQPLLITFILVAIKLLIMPLLNRSIVQHVPLLFGHYHHQQVLNETFSEFAFLYGTFPAAPTVYILSNIYNIETLIISAGLVISTLLSAPIIFVSTNMIRFSKQIDYNQLNNDLMQTIFAASIISLIGSLLLLYNFYLTFRLRSIIHRWSFKLLIGHIMIILAGILFRFNIVHNEDMMMPITTTTTISVFQYFLFQIGFFIMKLSLIFLSILLVFLYAKSLCFVIKISRMFTMIMLIILPIFIVMITITFGKTKNIADPNDGYLINLYYGINRGHLFLSCIMSFLTILTALISFILIHHFKNIVQHERQQLIDDNNVVDNDTMANVDDQSNPIMIRPPPSRLANQQQQQSSSSFDVEDLYQNLVGTSRTNLMINNDNDDDDDDFYKERCNMNCHSQCTNHQQQQTLTQNSSTTKKDCTDYLIKYKQQIEMAIEANEHERNDDHDSLPFFSEFHQIQQHLYLVMLSLLIIIIHSSIETSHLIADKPNGILIEMKFLDILFVFLHGFIMFILFGLDAEIILTKFHSICKMVFGSSQSLQEIYLPPMENLNRDAKEFCRRFCRDYREQCIKDITFRLSNGHNNTDDNDSRQKLYFCGRQLVDWLMTERLVQERSEAIDRCHQLLYGRVIDSRNNKPLDLGLSLRLANVSLNSELYLKFDPEKSQQKNLTILIQYSDKLRKIGEFQPDQTLWQFDGRTVLEQTRLKTLGLQGRVSLRLNCRPASDVQPRQKFVENIQFKKIDKEEDIVKVVAVDDVKLPPQQHSLPLSNEQPKTTDEEDKKSIPDPIIPVESSKKHKLNELEKEKENPIASPTIDNKKLEINFLPNGENDELLYSLDEQIDFVEEDLPPEFFEHTASDLKHLLAELRRQRSNDDQALETKQLRANREQQKRQQFKQTILRIIFPYDRLVMQAIFKPNDSIELIAKVIDKYIHHHSNINLFVAPPKTILDRQSNLFDLKLVPCGIIYCTPLNDKQPLIRDEFRNCLTTFSNVVIHALNKMKKD
uniref:Integral membrane protein GPR155-like n=1 Tax=Dermatophagoides pteronyssinus TaxID=6956 RepID=A0A6P6Y5K4_DERPT